jgi:hypothetical protein
LSNFDLRIILGIYISCLTYLARRIINIFASNEQNKLSNYTFKQPRLQHNIFTLISLSRLVLCVYEARFGKAKQFRG